LTWGGDYGCSTGDDCKIGSCSSSGTAKCVTVNAANDTACYLSSTQKRNGVCKLGSCTAKITCSNDSDCGTSDYTGSTYCSTDKNKLKNVYQKYITYTCKNPGTGDSKCVNSTDEKLKEQCQETKSCSNGNCAGFHCSNNKCVAGDASDTQMSCDPGDPKCNVCCTCMYQEVSDCANIKDKSGCIAYESPSGIRECSWDSANKKCVSRFSLYCDNYLNTISDCTVKNKTVREYFSSKDDYNSWISDKKAVLKCGKFTIYSIGHGVPEKKYFDEIEGCITSSGDGCAKYDFFSNGCQNFKNLAEVKRRIKRLEYLMEFENRGENPSVCEIKITANQAINFGSDLTAGLPITYTISNKDKTKIEYPPCASYEGADCYGQSVSLRRYDAGYCQKTDGSVTQIMCCPTHNFWSTSWAWTDVTKDLTCKNVAAYYEKQNASNQGSPNSKIKTKSFSLYFIRDSKNFSFDGTVYLITPHIMLNKDAEISFGDYSGISNPSVYKLSDDGEIDTVFNLCDVEYLDSASADVGAEGSVVSLGDKIGINIPAGAVDGMETIQVEGYNLSNCAKPDDAAQATADKFSFGLYNQKAAVFSLRNIATGGAENISYGTAKKGWLPIAGDWDNDGIDSVGVYNPKTSKFFLRNSNSSTSDATSFIYGTANKGWLPIAGDWNGDGIDTIGLYDPSTATFYLRNSNTAGKAQITLVYGTANKGWLPIAGDWNGDGKDTIGVYNPKTSKFSLRTTNAKKSESTTFIFGEAGWKPLAGDWNNDGTDTIALYDQTNAILYFRNTNGQGAADGFFPFGTAGAGLLPVAGVWGTITAVAGLDSNLFTAALTAVKVSASVVIIAVIVMMLLSVSIVYKRVKEILFEKEKF